MKKLIRIVAPLLASASFAAFASGAAYLKIEGIKGESRDKDHDGWIDVVSVSNLPDVASRAGGGGAGKVSLEARTAPRSKERASGLPTGKRMHKPIVITKPIDKATPALAKAASIDKATPALAEAASRRTDKASPKLAKEADKASPKLAKEADKASPKLAKEADKATPKLAEAARRSPDMGDMMLSVDGVRYRLKGARVLSVETSGDQETLTIHYEDITVDER